MKLDINFAKDLVANYRANHWSFLNGTTGAVPADGLPVLNGNEDSRSAWFGIDELKHFIHEIEKHHGSGVRIYYGEYSQNLTLPNGAPDPRAGMHTLLLIPTALDTETGYHCDFDLETRTSNYAQLVPGSTPAGTAAVAVNITALNHGRLIPPPYDLGPGNYQGADFMAFADQ